MALGKPVIATRAGGPCEIVDHGRTGLLVPPSDPPSLAAAIQDLLGDPAKCRAMGAASRLRYLQQFTARQMAVSTLAIYRQAMGLAESPAGHPASRASAVASSKGDS